MRASSASGTAPARCSATSSRGRCCGRWEDDGPPRVLRVRSRQGVPEPTAGLFRQTGSRAREIRLVLRSGTARLVEELNLGSEIGNALAVASDRQTQGPPNAAIAPEYPLLAVGVIEHQLQSPRAGVTRPSPQGVDVRPGIAGERAGEYSTAGFEELPVRHGRQCLPRTPTQDADIEVLVRAALMTQKQIDCPPAGDPPGARQVAQERRRLARMQWIPPGRGIGGRRHREGLYLPFQLGLRFSEKARVPSLRSSERITFCTACSASCTSKAWCSVVISVWRSSCLIAGKSSGGPSASA